MHGEHHADLRPGDLGQSRDLAHGVHAHLEHRQLVGRLQSQEGHGQTRLRVEIPDRCAGRDGPATRTSAIISLASVLPVEPVTPTTRTANRERHHAASCWSATQRVRHADDRGVHAGGRLDRGGDERGDRARAQRFVDEPMPVHPLPDQGHEARSPGSMALESTPAPANVVDPRGADETAAGDGEEVLDADRRRHATPCGDSRGVYQSASGEDEGAGTTRPAHRAATGVVGRSGGMAR